jgi:ABC-type nitrate/sulfonate/bicarbonate transport system substrate-binding protein
MSNPPNFNPNTSKPLRLGFVGLTDCAPLAVAEHLGLFARHGLNVEVSREPSWANVRDKLALGMLDGAHLLAPMLLATNLRLDKLSEPLCSSLSLGLGGNSIVLSQPLASRLQISEPDSCTPLESSQRLGRLLHDPTEVKTRRRKPRFAAVHPYSTHYYELCSWLAAGGIDPIKDIEVVYYPPQLMPQRLLDGVIDGFCVGEPWGSISCLPVIKGDKPAGIMIATGPMLWANKSEKMLAVSEQWAECNPDQHLALITALMEAGIWLDASAENRRTAARWLAEPQWIGQPMEQLLPGLALEDDVNGVPWLRFSRDNAQFPWRSHAVFYLAQMLRWGHINRAIDLRLIAERSYRPALYRHAAHNLDIGAPTIDYLPEGLHQQHWTLSPASPGPMILGPDTFFDQTTFNPFDIPGYLTALGANNAMYPDASSGINHLIPSLAHLALVNTLTESNRNELEYLP